MENKELINEFSKNEVSANADFVRTLLERYECFKNSKSEKQTPDKDYEILSRGTKIHHVPNDFCEELGCPIHSVKYLPDNTIFEVGQQTNNGVIKEILISKFGVLYFNCENEKGFGAYSIKNLKHIPKPLALFKTHDGVDIYDEGEYWHVDKNFTICHYNATINGAYCAEYALRCFWLEQTAINWALYNKACLSLKDIDDCRTKTMIGKYEQSVLNEDRLKKLVKSRIKL